MMVASSQEQEIARRHEQVALLSGFYARHDPAKTVGEIAGIVSKRSGDADCLSPAAWAELSAALANKYSEELPSLALRTSPPASATTTEQDEARPAKRQRSASPPPAAAWPASASPPPQPASRGRLPQICATEEQLVQLVRALLRPNKELLRPQSTAQELSASLEEVAKQRGWGKLSTRGEGGELLPFRVNRKWLQRNSGTESFEKVPKTDSDAAAAWKFHAPHGDERTVIRLSDVSVARGALRIAASGRALQQASGPSWVQGLQIGARVVAAADCKTHHHVCNHEVGIVEHVGELCGDKFLDTVLDVRAACGHVERILASNLEPTERAFCPHDACVHWALAQTGRWENTEVMRARDNEILARQQLAQEREERKKAELVLQTQRNVLQINQIKVDERGVPLEPQRSQQSRKRSKMSGPEDRPTDSETPGTAATATTDTAAPEGSAVGHAEVDAAALQTELGSLRTENETLRRQNRMHADQLAAVEAANVKEHRTAEARTLKAQIEAKEAKRELKVERAKAAAVRLAADTPSGALTAAPTAEAASTAAAAAPTALAAAAMGPSDPNSSATPRDGVSSATAAAATTAARDRAAATARDCEARLVATAEISRDMATYFKRALLAVIEQMAPPHTITAKETTKRTSWGRSEIDAAAMDSNSLNVPDVVGGNTDGGGGGARGQSRIVDLLEQYASESLEVVDELTRADSDASKEVAEIMRAAAAAAGTGAGEAADRDPAAAGPSLNSSLSSASSSSTAAAAAAAAVVTVTDDDDDDEDSGDGDR
jgi:hypothetical protein